MVPSRVPSLSVILSFKNEEQVIPELVSRLRAVLGGLLEQGRLSRFELVFVNDASTDGSLPLLRRLAEGHDDIRVLSMSRTFGVSPCVLAGMEWSRGDLVVYMDADLQDPPEVIPRLLDAWASEPDVDVVHTLRVARDGEAWYKLLLTKIGYALIRRVATIELPIEAGDFKLLSRHAINLLIEFREKRPYLRGLVCWIGLKQVRVEYHRESRYAGATKFPVFGYQVLQNFLESALISFSDVPLRLSMVIGQLTSVVALLYVGWIALELIRGHAIPPWSVVMLVVLLSSGIQLFCVGLQGLYIGSIFVETKRRPNYIIQDTFGFDSPPPARQDVGSRENR